MAATEENNDSNDKELVWGTWEELLLVSALNRHGTRNWDAVVMEIQNRINTTSSSSPRFSFRLTPHICKQKYQHLRRRFVDDDDSNNNTTNNSTMLVNNIEDEEIDTIPWLEELRKLRVAELRREVEQYDVSIVSLQSKVKKLTEDRERSNQDGVKSDLETPATDSAPEKPVSGEDSDPDNQSFNESNSTDPKDDNRETDMDIDDLIKKQDVKETAVVGDSDPVTSGSKPVVGEGSYNGSSETIARDSVNRAFVRKTEPIPKREEVESTELWESVAESKGTKENSDVQSSASLSKETRREKEISVNSSGDEPEADGISPAIKRISVKSSPLVKFLEIVKSSRYGHVFERRIEIQETSKYKSLIRQHLDLETINKRLKAGQYSSCSPKFFRDFLLLINNAIVFFPKDSIEYTAAIELRQIVSKENSLRLRKSSQVTEVRPQPSAPTIPPTPAVKSEPEPSNSLLGKPKSTLPMIACRKRSSITTKGASEKKEPVIEEKKAVVERKLLDKGLISLVEDQMVIKKGKRDKPASGARSSRPAKKNPNPISNLNPSPSSSNKGGAAAADEDNSEKVEKEKSHVNAVAKKRSVTNFLNRMKTNNSTSNGPLVESLKNSGNGPSNVKGGSPEQKKPNGGKGGGDARKEQGKRHTSKKDSSPPAKRGVGRPPKRNASSSPITPPPPSKRSKETLEADVSTSRQARKRAKR